MFPDWREKLPTAEVVDRLTIQTRVRNGELIVTLIGRDPQKLSSQMYDNMIATARSLAKTHHRSLPARYNIRLRQGN